MKKFKTATAFLILLSLFVFTFQVARLTGNERPDKNKGRGIAWATFDQGMELAKKEKKVLVVDFYTDWCSWCKVMDKETYENSEVVDYARKNLVMAKINAETTDRFNYRGTLYAGRELTMMFGVRGFPATVFFTDSGELITVLSGYIPADRFYIIAKYLAEGWYEKMKFEDFEKQETSKG
jgi:thioredoxin-related protein